jgi:hypothetical protein
MLSRAAVVNIVAETGQTIGGHTLTNLLNGPFINNSGQVAYTGDYSGGEAIFRDQSAVVSAGDAVGANTFGIIYGGQPVINNNGLVGFTFRNPAQNATLIGNSAGFSASFGPVDGLNLLSIGQFAMNDSGSMVFASSIFENGNVKEVIASPAHILVRQGDVIDGVSMDNVDVISTASYNNAGTFIFQTANTANNVTYLMTQTKKLVGTGSIISGNTLSNIDGDAAINDSGTIAFTGFFASNSASGIFTNDHLVITRGATIGTHTIQSFGPFGFGDVDINNAGTVAFLANYTGGGMGVLVNQSVALQTGDIVDGKTITSLGKPIINDSGLVVAWAQFNDGSQAILTATVPEPMGSTIFATAALALGSRRRRRR